MLYSESIERQKRFKLALKIAFPFFFFLASYIFFFKNEIDEVKDYILLTSFILVYIYYIFYMIYLSFQISLLDNYTKAFNSKGIIKEIEKIVKNKEDGFVAMIFIKNITFIEEQYGADVKNLISEVFVEKLNDYLKNLNYKNIPIGRYQTGSFLLIFKKHKNKKLIKHIITGFCKSIEKQGINNIELRVDLSIIEISYDNNVKNIISKLINLPLEEENNLNVFLKPDEFDIMVKNAVENQSLTISYHSIFSFDDKKSVPVFYSTNIKLDIDHFGTFTKTQIFNSINKIGLEIIYDINVIKKIFTEVRALFKKKNDIKIMIKISSVSFRNQIFLINLKELLKEYDIKAENICLMLGEKKMYEDTLRFKNIINEYKNIGFLIGFDEFGTNNIGFDYLREDIEFDVIAFDLDFTKNIDNKKYFYALETLLNFSRKIDVKTIIRFIDKKRIEDKVRELKPDYVQGFLYGKPKYIKEIIEEKNEIW